MSTDYGTACERLVANMLTGTNAAERIAELKEMDKTTLEKLKVLVHKAA